MYTLSLSRSSRRLLGLLVSGSSLLLAGTPTFGATQLPSLDLASAIRQVREQHPALQVFALRGKQLSGLQQQADLAPPLRVGLEIEDFAGTGDTTGFDSAEFTLSLSSVIELGGKQAARSAVYDARQQSLAMQRDAAALQRMGQLAQTFISALATQERLGLAADSIALNETALDIARRRSQAGATSEIEVLQAEAALEQSRLARDQLQSLLEQQKMLLANQQGLQDIGFSELAGNLFRFQTADDFSSLFQRASSNPAIAYYASESRVREAELTLAASQSSLDIAWNLGVRRYEGPDDAALVAGFSVPLFSQQRNQGQLAASRSARDQVHFEQETALLALHARLYQAYRQRQASIQQVEKLQQQVIPLLEKAVQQSREAYDRGRFSYQAWTIARRDLITARNSLIDAAATAQLNQALIEQLTAVPLTGTHAK